MSIHELEPQDKPKVGGDGSDRSTEPKILVQETMGRGDGHRYAATRTDDLLRGWSATTRENMGIQESE